MILKPPTLQSKQQPLTPSNTGFQSKYQILSVNDNIKYFRKHLGNHCICNFPSVIFSLGIRMKCSWFILIWSIRQIFFVFYELSNGPYFNRSIKIYIKGCWHANLLIKRDNTSSYKNLVLVPFQLKTTSLPNESLFPKNC